MSRHEHVCLRPAWYDWKSKRRRPIVGPGLGHPIPATPRRILGRLPRCTCHSRAAVTRVMVTCGGMPMLNRKRSGESAAAPRWYQRLPRRLRCRRGVVLTSLVALLVPAGVASSQSPRPAPAAAATRGNDAAIAEIGAASRSYLDALERGDGPASPHCGQPTATSSTNSAPSGTAGSRSPT